MSTYPGTLDSFTSNTDGVDDVLAADVNELQQAIVATQTELGTDPAGTATDVKTRLSKALSNAGFLKFVDATELTISTGVITKTQNYHIVDTESDAASDDLDTINGGAAADVIFLRIAASARNVVIKHGTGNISCAGAGDITMDTTGDLAIGVYDGALSVWTMGKVVSGTSTLTGAGTATQLALYSSANVLASDADLSYASNVLTIGSAEAGVDYAITVNGETSDGTLTYMEDEGYWTTTQEIRATTTLYRRYYHIPLAAINPGGSGATWTAPSANTLGGWLLDAAGEVLYLQTDVHADWDAASDLTMEVKFEVNVDNSGGGAGDTVDLKLVCYYKGNAETATKTQTQEVATVVGASARYKRFTCTFTINYDEAANVVESGDVIRCILNLETDTSEVDNIILNSCEFYYNTTHMGIEAGDT